MNHYPEFAKLINELIERSPDLTNQMLAGGLNLHFEVIEHWRNGSRIPESNSQVKQLMECLHKHGVPLTDAEVRRLYSASRQRMTGGGMQNVARPTPTRNMDGAALLEARISLESLGRQLERTGAQPRMSQEAKEEIEQWAVVVNDVLSRIPFAWDPRELDLRVIPQSTLENLARIGLEENILFTAIGMSGGAILSLLVSYAAGEPTAQVPWAVLGILVIVTVFLISLLVLVRRHKR